MSEETLFAEALERADPRERTAFLDDACPDNPALRRRIERLLAQHQHAGAFLEAPPLAHVPATEELLPEHAGSMIGPYRLLEQLGEGGFGVVFLAEQTQPVHRRVALKVIKPGMDNRHFIARFEAERQALALMDHPNIAKVHDAGATSEGRPFFVMELVEGIPITRYCDEHRLTLRERLALFVPVCRAIQHAHQKGIIHRDLKPSNVLVALCDEHPVIKVIDFGVAKAIGQELTEETLHTGFGAVVGTVEYMSPEQASLNQLDVDTRSDIYALGVLLYELLTGSPPFCRKELEKAGMLDALRIIREREPSTPSAKLSAVEGLPNLAMNRGTEPAKLTRLVRGELDWIVMKCLEKDRNRRYETSNSLAMDLNRYLRDEPVLACPPSAWYRFGKLVRRSKAAFVVGSTVALAVLVSLVGLVIANVRIDREKTQKERALAEAEANLLLARQAVDEIYEEVASQPDLLPYLHPFQRFVWQKALRFYQEFAQRTSGDPAIRLEAARASRRALSIGLMLGQPGPYEQRCREVIAAIEQLAHELPSEPKRRLALADAHSFLANVLVTSGRDQEAEKNRRQAVAIYGALAAERPGVPEYRWQLAAALNSLAGSFRDRPREAEPCHREAIRLCAALATERPDEPLYQGERANSYFRLGHSEAGAKRFSQAEDAFRQAIAIFDKASTPLNRTTYRFLSAEAQCDLGGVLKAQGRVAEAEAAYRQAVAAGERSVAQWPDIPDYSLRLTRYYSELSRVLAQSGRIEEAATFTRARLDLFEKVLPDLTAGTQSREQAIAVLSDWGRSLRDAGELKDAERALRQALEAARRLAEQSPTEPSPQRILAQSHAVTGTILLRARRFQEAAAAHREELAIYEKLAAAFPADPDYRYHQARAANFLGTVLRRLPKETEAAAGYHRQAIKLCEPLPAQFPDQPRYHIELIRSHYALGLALVASSRWVDAQASFGQALADVVPLGSEGPAQMSGKEPPIGPSVRNDLAWLLATCPDVKIRDPRRAVELATKAVELDPHGSYFNTLGVAHYRAGSFKEAVTALQKSMELQKGGDSFDWLFLAMAHRRLNNTELARQWYDKAVVWMDKHASQNDELRRFRAEAQEVLGINQKR
jgi:serine/threonine protein kinase